MRRPRSAPLSVAFTFVSIFSVQGFSPISSPHHPTSVTSFEKDYAVRKFPNDAVMNVPGQKSPSLRRKGLSRAKSSAVSSERSTPRRPGLSREEEIEFSFRLRTLQAAMKVRRRCIQESETSAPPSNQEWAEACGTTVMALRRVLHDGQEARTAVVAANIGLVTSIAKRQYYSLKQATEASNGVGTILSRQDLIQEGTLGLIKAAERFDPERGFRFSTYATYWVRQRILKAVSDSSRTIRLPAHVHGILSKVSKARAEIKSDTGRDASLEEISQHLEIPAKKIQIYTQKARNVMSLEMPVGTSTMKEDRRTLGDSLASDAPTPEEFSEASYLRQDVQQVMDAELATAERDVLGLRFGLATGQPKTVVETAQILEIGRDRVRLIEARALNKLRKKGNYRLKQYVETEPSKTLSLKKKTLAKESADGGDSGRIWFF